MKNIVLTELNPVELKESIRSVFAEELKKALGEAKLNEEEKLLSRKEVADLLQVTIVTIDRWTKLGYIPVINIGRRKRYNKGKVLESVQSKKAEQSK